MSNCDKNRDFNNNYLPYMNSNVQQQQLTNNCNNRQVTAKVMFGSIDAIKDLREKEQAEKNNAARAGRR